MILDDINQFKTYLDLHTSFKHVYSFLNENNLESLFRGKEILNDKLHYIIVDQKCISYQESLNFFEAHDQHIDIHICFEGKERIIWKNRSDCKKVKKDDLFLNDVIFFDEIPEIEFTLNPNYFCVFFPNDVHASLIGDSNIKKIVFKIKIN
jgi:biofilm protein TabA